VSWSARPPTGWRPSRSPGLRPYVAVLDVSMPRCKRDPGHQPAPACPARLRVGLISALGWPAMADAARRAGAHRYVAKSAPAHELLDAVFG
jgi:DNA-binding NarL/FixJ family response regulator